MSVHTLFTLQIDIGNDAMLSNADVVEALASVSSRVAEGCQSGVIRDVNGNDVGTFAHLAVREHDA